MVDCFQWYTIKEYAILLGVMQEDQQAALELMEHGWVIGKATSEGVLERQSHDVLRTALIVALVTTSLIIYRSHENFHRVSGPSFGSDTGTYQQ